MVTFSDSGGCEGSRHASTNSGCLATNAKAPPYGRAFFRMSHRGALLGRGPLGRSEEGDHRGITCFPAPAHSAPLCPSNPSRPHGGAGRSLVNPGWTTTRSSWVEPEGVEPSSVTAAALVNAKAFRLMCSRVPAWGSQSRTAIPSSLKAPSRRQDFTSLRSVRGNACGIPAITSSSKNDGKVRRRSSPDVTPGGKVRGSSSTPSGQDPSS